MKDKKDSVKVAEGDVMKFGRVRFRVKKLVINNKEACKDFKLPLPTQNIDSLRMSDVSLVQDTMIYSRRSSDAAGMDNMMRLHSSANHSFDIKKG